MTTAPPRPARTPLQRRPRHGPSGLFRAVWRWHFYASFLVVPVLLVLAVTGLVYLFRFQLEPLLHPDLMKVSAPSDTAIQQPYANQLAGVERAHPDATVVSMAEPREDGRSTVFSVTTEDGAARDVFVNPYGAEVLGSLDPDRTVSGIAVLLHRYRGVVRCWGGNRPSPAGRCHRRRPCPVRRRPGTTRPSPTTPPSRSVTCRCGSGRRWRCPT